MHILLLSNTPSITETLQLMLQSIDDWSISVKNNIEDLDSKNESTEEYDLLIVNLEDFEVPSTNTISKVRQNYPDLPLLVIHSYINKALIKPLIAAGASGYIQNNISEGMLIKAVRKVASGAQHIVVEST